MFYIHVRNDKTTISYIDEHFRSNGEAPLAYSAMEVWIYKGYCFIGIIRNGFIHCSAWGYKVKFGKLVVACRVDEI